MKPITILKLFAVAIVAAMFTGCAHMGDASKSKHTLRHEAAALPPGWTLVTANIANSATSNNLIQIATVAVPPTNSPGFWTALISPRPHFFTDYEETWEDSSHGGGTFVLTDPAASQVAFGRVNQTALGGGHTVAVGQLSSTTTTNDVNAISAGGTAIGNVIGAAASAAAK
jgi:hypothetical protein